MSLKQGYHSNEDFIKLVSKELKVFEKRGGDFLWGDTCRKKLTKCTKILEDAYVADKGVTMTKDELMDAKRLVKKEIKEEVLAITILKRADKRRYGSLQIDLWNSYLLGHNKYPTSVPDVLKILNNYTPDFTILSSPLSHSTITGSTGITASSSVSFLQSNGHQVRYRYQQLIFSPNYLRSMWNEGTLRR